MSWILPCTVLATLEHSVSSC